MKPLFSEEEFREAKTKDKLPCECEQCGETFYKIKHDIQKVYSGRKPGYAKFCSKKCQHENHGYRKCRIGKETGYKCKQCNKPAIYYSYETTGDFCSKQCAVTYSSTINQKQKDESLRRKYGNFSGVSLKNKPTVSKKEKPIKIKENKIQGYCRVSFCNSCNKTLPYSKNSYCLECGKYSRLKLFYSKLNIIENNLPKANELAINKFKELYFELELSKVDLQHDYNLDTNSIFRFAKSNNIKLRTVKDGLKLAILNGKGSIVNPYNSNHYRNGHYTGHTGQVMYLKSGYEFIVAEELDKLKTYYEYEKIRIPYIYNGEQHTYVSDFYIPKYNLILEPKSDYFFKQRKDKYYQQYLSTLNSGYELHYLFDKDIKKIKNISSIKNYYTEVLNGRKYF